MRDGFIKVAAVSPKLVVADTNYNTDRIKEYIDRADRESVNIIVFPELAVTGYCCADLFFSDMLIKSTYESLKTIRDYSKGKYPVIAVGTPLRCNSRLYNCAAVIHDGRILAFIPKTYIPNYNEFYEKRWFASGRDFESGDSFVVFDGESIPVTVSDVFRHKSLDNYTFGVEICEDIWVCNPPSEKLCRKGAEIILNLSASNETVGKSEYRRLLVKSTSARLFCGYVYSSSGTDESTTDLVFSAHNIISDDGNIIAENPLFNDDSYITSEIDVNRIANERCKNTEFSAITDSVAYIFFDQEIRNTTLTRSFPKNPFVPSDNLQVNERAETILKIQSYGLKKRFIHSHSKSLVIGISGGLDSSLALLAAVRTMDLMNLDHKNVIAVTMPGFGTTSRTKNNAVSLCEELGVTLREISIAAAVRQHFADIGHDESIHNVVYENSQAREHTQVLMDVANQCGGIVVGTGDLSELALGWATYNGDHMSMYGVNASIPKTLVRYIIRYEAENLGGSVRDILLDILDTPVSPELLPSDENGKISQVTEDLVGPYELHDFFLYYMMRCGFGPRKVFRIAEYSFMDDEKYDKATILKWLKVFIRRFFIQQFKRSCLPDGPKVGSVSLSPRGDWRMPSDASFEIWMREADSIIID